MPSVLLVVVMMGSGCVTSPALEYLDAKDVEGLVFELMDYSKCIPDGSPALVKSGGSKPYWVVREVSVSPNQPPLWKALNRHELGGIVTPTHWVKPTYFDSLEETCAELGERK